MSVSENVTDTNTFLYDTLFHTRDNHPRHQAAEWEDFKKIIRHRLTKDDTWEDKDGPMWSPAHFRGGKKKEDVKFLSAIVLDLDGKDEKWQKEQIREVLEGIRFGAHTTFQHTTEQPRIRVILPLTQPLPPDRLQIAQVDLWSQIGLKTDPGAIDASRCYFLPSCARWLGKYSWVIWEEGKRIDQCEWWDVGVGGTTYQVQDVLDVVGGSTSTHISHHGSVTELVCQSVGCQSEPVLIQQHPPYVCKPCTGVQHSAIIWSDEHSLWDELSNRINSDSTYVPTSIEMRNKCLLNYARDVCRVFPHFRSLRPNKYLTYLLSRLFNHWWSLAEPVVRTKDWKVSFREFKRFLFDQRTYEGNDLPSECDTLDKIAAYRLGTGRRTFFLSSYDAAKQLNVCQTTATRKIERQIELGLWIRIKKGTRYLASEYSLPV